RRRPTRRRGRTTTSSARTSRPAGRELNHPNGEEARRLRGSVRALASVALLAILWAGCLGGCDPGYRYEAWVQPSLWDFRPAAGHPALVPHAAPTGPRWPEPPAVWRGNHSVVEVILTVEPGFELHVRPEAGADSATTLHVSGLLPPHLRHTDQV